MRALLKPIRQSTTHGFVLRLSDRLPQWSASSNRWDKIGEVVDAVGSSQRQLHEGVEYDYVFDVDIGEDTPPLKLPYNATGWDLLPVS